MIDDIVSALGKPAVPDHAMTFRELMEVTNSGEDTLRRWLRDQIKAGRWIMGRDAGGVFYWQADQDDQ
jgi:hypothetical protein